MNCNKCNKKIPEKSNFCPNCGAKIEKNIKSEKSSENKPQSINPLYIIIFAGVLAIFAVLLILDSNTTPDKVVQQNAEMPTQQSSEIFSKIDALTKQLENDPDNIVINTELGNNYFDAKQYDKAIPFYKKAIELNPNNVEVRIDLAVSYYNIQIVDTALVEIKNALELNPHHQQGLFNIGVMYYNLGNKDKAKEYWDQLIQFHNGSEAAETAKQLLQNI